MTQDLKPKPEKPDKAALKEAGGMPQAVTIRCQNCGKKLKDKDWFVVSDEAGSNAKQMCTECFLAGFHQENSVSPIEACENLHRALLAMAEKDRRTAEQDGKPDMSIEPPEFELLEEG